MAHLSKAQVKKMETVREDMASYLKDLMAGIERGEIGEVIQFCNSASIRIDVQCLLKRRLSASECDSLSLTPEACAGLYGVKFGRACMIAYNMKTTRQLCRTMLRRGYMEGVKMELENVLRRVNMEAYAL